MANPTGGGLQTLARTLVHTPFQGDLWQLYLFNLAIGGDACLEKLNQGVHDTFTGDADASALPYIAAQRGNILRGLTESDSSYRERLRTALDDLRIAGAPWAILRQVLGYLLSYTPEAATVSSRYSAAGVCTSSTWDYFNAGQSTAKNPNHVLYNTGGAGDWDWDSLSPTDGSWGWWRWYLRIRATAPNAWVGPEGKWGAGSTWEAGADAWGVNVSANVGRSIKIIVGQWKANWLDWVIISFDDTEFVPGAAVLPDGHYGRWSKLVGGAYVAARSANARYFRGQ